MAATCAVAVTLLATPAGSAPSPAGCDALDLSPAFATDRTALCIGIVKDRIDLPATGVQVYLTTDAGRSWQRRQATGLPFHAQTQWRQVVFSPSYASDRTIYVQEAFGGLYATTDGGATFTLADPLATANTDLPNLAQVGRFVPLTDALPSSALAYAGTVPALLSPPVHRPVAGSGLRSARSFLVPRAFPDKPAYLVALMPNPAEGTAQYRIFTCDVAFTCTTEIGAVAPGWNVLAAELVGHDDDQRLVVVARMPLFGPDWGKVVVWRSTPDGARLERLPSLENVIKPIGADVRSVGVTTFGRGEFAVLLDGRHWSQDHVPERQLYVSSRGGTAWRRIAHRHRGFEKRPGQLGPLPERGSYASSYNAARLWTAPTGRIFMVGARGAHLVSTVYCSDNGVTWRYTC